MKLKLSEDPKEWRKGGVDERAWTGDFQQSAAMARRFARCGVESRFGGIGGNCGGRGR
jgi:hypothetical protein